MIPGQDLTRLEQIKARIKSRYPKLTSLIIHIILWRYSLSSKENTFSEIYHFNKWDGEESVSGCGSDSKQTKYLLEAIPNLIKQYNIKTILDAGCGDYNWLSKIEIDIDKYIGIDIVPELIIKNNKRYGNLKILFSNYDIALYELTKVDLIICRDVFVHLSYKDIYNALINFKRSNSKYILITTFPMLLTNVNIPAGCWRKLNFQIDPFNFPEPLQMINEQCPLQGHADKSLGLWRLEDIPLS